MSDWYLVMILLLVVIPLGILFWSFVVGMIIQLVKGKKIIEFKEEDET